MTNFYRRLSNCQPHHTVQISAVSTTVLTTTTTPHNTKHGARYNSTERTTLPLPGKSQHAHLSTVNVHNNRPIDSAHFAQPMSCDSGAILKTQITFYMWFLTHTIFNVCRYFVCVLCHHAILKTDVIKYYYMSIGSLVSI